MDSNERRQAILDTIKNSAQPLTGSHLSRQFKVSRQVIVQDVAILRAGGNDIIATPQGYMISPTTALQRYRRIIPCKHLHSGMEEELLTIVDFGGKILDVIIEHPVYGEFRGNLMINSRNDVLSFIKRMNTLAAEPLASLTEGVHLHTVEADNEDIMNKIEKALEEKGILLSDE